MTSVDDDLIRRVLHAFAIADAKVEPLAGGLIHRTYAVSVPGRELVLQRVSPMFAVEVHDNIAAATKHLRARNEAAPELLETTRGRPWIDLEQDGVWRLMTRLPGRALVRINDVAQARSAGRRLARFHAALADCPYRFVRVRPPGHDRQRHTEAFVQAAHDRSAHRLHARVGRLADEVLPCLHATPAIAETPDLLGHGDPKLANILFASDADGAMRAASFIDFDTVGPAVHAFEWGDAWRSWCSSGAEDDASPSFDLQLFAASWDGAQQEMLAELSPAQRHSLLYAPEWIALELCMRFATDALLESYFGWDPSRYPAAGEHNLARAQTQLRLHHALVTGRSARAEILGV